MATSDIGPVTPIETRKDFRTDTCPSLFIDNWGEDVVAQYGSKIQAPLDSMVALAQVMSSIHEAGDVDPTSLDVEALRGMTFVDGTDGQKDHFFNVDLRARFVDGSYPGTRVSASFMTGYVQLESYADSDTTHASYERRWSTLRSDVISQRDPGRFRQDVTRLIHALEMLEGLSEDSLQTTRPDTWPGQPADLARRYKTLTGLNFAQTPIYVSEIPLEDVVIEPDRTVRVLF